MDVINKIYTSVQVSVSAVLPGNIVTKEYELLQQVTSAGIGNLDLQWKVYSGLKRTTKQEVSIFVFEKKSIESWPKERRDPLLEILRHGVHQLTKMKHPRILTVQHPLEESRDSLAFATEPVLTSLSNVLEDSSSEVKFFDIEIVHGFQQIIDGLIFIHSDADIIHGNISPETILIDKKRNWKIFGFDFSVRNNLKNDLYTSNNSIIHPCHTFMAPETTSSGITFAESDTYSLGMLMYCICIGQSPKHFNKTLAFTKNNMKSNPCNLSNTLKSMIHPSPNHRPTLQELTQLQHFQGIGVKTLNYLDTLYQWNNLQKSQFFKTLMQIIPNFPHRVNMFSVIPHLVQEFVHLPMIPFVLPIILHIAEMSTQQEYKELILPALKLVFGIEEPIQIPLILIQNMNVLLKYATTDDINAYIVPLVSRSLELESTELQELCLEIVPHLSPIVESYAIKESVLPRVKNLYLKCTYMPIKVKCLICIGKLLEYLDRCVFFTDVLPFLQQVENREPVIIMAVIGVYRIALSNPKHGITAEALATKCIPYLIPLCTENTLSVSQFDCVTAIIREMFEKVEKEYRAKLEQLAAVNQANSISSTSYKNSALLQYPRTNVDHTDIYALPGQRVSSDNKASGEIVCEKNTNPLVLGQQLMTPTYELTNGEIKNKYPPINYIYPPLFNLANTEPQRVTRACYTEESNSQKSVSSELVPLSQQDIINFLN